VLTEPGEPPRYRLFESTRALAIEELQRCGELAERREAHAHATPG
jgi:predicted ATPase